MLRFPCTRWSMGLLSGAIFFAARTMMFQTKAPSALHSLRERKRELTSIIQGRYAEAAEVAKQQECLRLQQEQRVATERERERERERATAYGLESEATATNQEQEGQRTASLGINLRPSRFTRKNSWLENGICRLRPKNWQELTSLPDNYNFV